ncbi:MAG TPA: phosphotransferase family protein [Candidatus Udaeobacter sp.]|jgi:aminoglycoside phosphotransferase (APT) family kinase protein|nr:phosphotransferase family protein [Candidatus Udaeobacter sp.]
MADLLDHPTTVRQGEELDLGRLEPFLRIHFPNEPGPLSIQQFPSGHSNLTYSLRFGSKELVLRRPPFGSKVKSAHDMGREFRVLSRLHSVYAPSPKVLIYSEDESILGIPFYLMEPIHGVILRRDPPLGLDFSPEKARRLSESFVENLALLHGLDCAAAGLADLGKPQGYLERQVRGWTERYHGSKTHDYPEMEKISAWMQQHIPSTGGASLIHNDYKYDNVVLDPGDITKILGVLDWEMCTIGDPLADLGTALAYWVDAADPEELQENRSGPTTHPGSLTRAELVEYYAQKTGRDVSQMSFFLTLARFKLAVIVQQIYYRYHQGLTKDERFASLPRRINILLRASLHSAQTGTI